MRPSFTTRCGARPLRPAKRPIHSLIVTTPTGDIRFASVDARRWLRDFFGRSARVGLLPPRLQQWVAGRGPHAGKKSIVITRQQTRLFVTRYNPHPSDAIALLLETSSRRKAAMLRRQGNLTRRETEVLEWIAAGKSNRDMAEILAVAPATIGKHLEHIFRKLGVENRTAAASFHGRRIKGDHALQANSLGSSG